MPSYEESPAIGQRPSKKLRWFLVSLVILATLVGAWLVIDKWCQRLLQAAMRPARLAHEPLTVAEVEALRPKVPDAENMALTLLRAGDAIGVYENSAEFKSFSDQLPFEGTLPTPPFGTRLTAEQRKAAHTFLAGIAADLAEVKKAARSGKGRYPITWQAMPIATLLPFLSPHRRVVKSLCVEALAAAADERPDAAAAALQTALQTDAALAEQPTVFVAVIRATHVAVTVDTAARVISLGGLAESHLKALQNQLADIEHAWSIHFAMLSERAATCESLAVAYRDRDASLATGAMKLGAIGVIPGTPYLDQEALWRLCSTLCDATRLEPLAALQRVKTLESEIQRLPQFCIGARFLTPCLSHEFALWFRTLGVIRATQAALAAERFRLARGHWPDALADLVPAYLGAVPADPFDGKPLRYVHDARGIRIWSIGEDVKDDGGEVEGYTKLKKASDFGAFLVNPDLRGREL